MSIDTPNYITTPICLYFTSQFAKGNTCYTKAWRSLENPLVRDERIFWRLIEPLPTMKGDGVDGSIGPHRSRRPTLNLQAGPKKNKA